MADDIGGVWRTIGGRRVFIKTGQTLSQAMKESGKFKGLGKRKIKNVENAEKINKDISSNIMSIKQFKNDVRDGKIDKNAKVIASTSTDENLGNIKKSNKLVLRYDDVNEGKNAFNEKMAKEIVKFTENLKEDDKLYIVCDYGQSRSSAIASAISLKYNNDDKKIWNNPQYAPNKKVYSTMLKAFGIEISDDQIEEKIKQNNEALKKKINSTR